VTPGEPTSPHFPDAFYRVVAKGLCVRDRRILLVKDFSSPLYAEAGGLWELPGGGVDFGETPQDALRREIREEMGLEPISVATNPMYFWSYKRLNKRDMPWHWVLILGFRFDVANLDFIPSDECREMGFFSPEELIAAPVGDQMEPLRTLFDPVDFE
jgi:8-oxo-dGTP pyrophosphatase MutT (NUDIX family)